MTNKIVLEIELFSSEAFSYILPLVKKLALDLEKGVLPLAEAALMSAVTGTAWPVIASTFIASAAAKGIAISEADAMTVLSAAEANLAAKGTPAAVTVASTPAPAGA